ncbi:TonB-dependent receptor [Yokenella regensburgei]|uniref:TonB-dependent receptor n=1 Tax=Yokenella regensburgei TaxID=158877 RepID=UPI0013762213|nr:TonB-dependent receptor plug domain-containing protein [Yokenella regensburgei]
MHTAFSPLALCLFTPLSLAAVSDVEDVIVVTGDNRNAQQQASSSVSVSRETMEQQGSLTVVDALQHVPGIQLRYGGKGVPQLDIRGYKSRDITFLVNGVPQNSAWDSQFDPQLIPVGLIERIDITKGGSGSLLYGSGGFGGVINVITRRSDGEPHSALAVGAGNGGHYTANANTSGAAGALEYAASYAYDGKDGFPMAADFTPSGQQGDGRRNNSDNRNHALATSLNWQTSEDTRLGLNLNYRHDSWGVPDKLGGSGNGGGGGGGGGGKGNAKPEGVQAAVMVRRGAICGSSRWSTTMCRPPSPTSSRAATPCAGTRGTATKPAIISTAGNLPIASNAPVRRATAAICNG